MHSLVLALALGVASLPVPWAPRLDGGAIRVLFVAPQSALQDVDELALRLEMKYETVAVFSSQQLASPGDSGDETVEKLREEIGRDWDVLVTGNLDLGMFPEDVLGAIREKIEQGRGLVVANHRDSVPEEFRQFLEQKIEDETAADITRGVGASMTTEWPSSLGFVAAGRIGEGRVVELNYAASKPDTHFVMPDLTDPLRARPEYFDVYASLVARAVRWAAGRRPAVAVAGVEDISPKGPKDDQIPPGMPEEYVQQIKDNVVRSLFRPYRVRLEEPAKQRYRVYAQVREPSRGLRAEYPDLPPLEKGQNEYRLEIPVGPGAYFLDIWFYDGKDIVEWHTANIVVEGWPEISELDWSKGNLLPNDRLVISLNVRPHYHRPRPCTVYARATDALGRMVAENSVEVAAAGGPVQLGLNFADLLSNLVKVELYVADATGRTLSQWDLDHAAYSHIYMPVRAKTGGVCSVVAETSILDEYNARKWLSALAEAGVDSVCASSSEDARFCLAERNLRPVPNLMQVTQLTGEPETGNHPWRELVPAYWATGTRLYSLGAAPALTPALAASRDTVRGIDPEALVGVRVTLAEEPPDWCALAAGFDFLAVPDDRLALCKVRSYRREGSVALMAVESAPGRAQAWRQAVYQMDGLWLMRPFSGAAEPVVPNAVAAGGDFTPGFTEMMEAVGELRSGVGYLLRNAVRQADVAVIEGGSREVELELVGFLQSHGYGFDFLTADDVAAGNLYRYKAAVTPKQKLNEDLRAALQDFQTRGGRVAAMPENGERFELEGLEPRLAISGRDAGAVSSEVLKFGAATLFTFLPNEPPDKKKLKFKVEPTIEGNLYDVRAGKRKRGKKISVSLAGNEAAVLASLPYIVDRIELTTLDSVRLGHRLPLSVAIKTKKGAPGAHVVHVEFGPVGEPGLKHYAQDIVCRGGEGATFIPLALNEQPGSYLVRVKDVMSDNTDERRVDVMPVGQL